MIPPVLHVLRMISFVGELAISGAYVAAGFALLRSFEAEARRHATLERS